MILVISDIYYPSEKLNIAHISKRMTPLMQCQEVIYSFIFSIYFLITRKKLCHKIYLHLEG